MLHQGEHVRHCLMQVREKLQQHTMTMSPTATLLIVTFDGAPSLRTVTTEPAGKQQSGVPAY